VRSAGSWRQAGDRSSTGEDEFGPSVFGAEVQYEVVGVAGELAADAEQS
jgi:hypothetical protein